MRKITSLNLDIDKIQLLDQYIKLPCSRSDVVNDILGYVLQSPYVIEAFVKSKLDELNHNALTSVNNT